MRVPVQRQGAVPVRAPEQGEEVRALVPEQGEEVRARAPEREVAVLPVAQRQLWLLPRLQQLLQQLLLPLWRPQRLWLLLQQRQLRQRLLQQPLLLPAVLHILPFGDCIPPSGGCIPPSVFRIQPARLPQQRLVRLQLLPRRLSEEPPLRELPQQEAEPGQVLIFEGWIVHPRQGE